MLSLSSMRLPKSTSNAAWISRLRGRLLSN